MMYNKKVKNSLWTLLFIFLLILIPAISFADTHNCDPGGGRICNPLSTADTVQDFIRILLEGVLKIGIPIVALAIIYSGFLFVAARGNEEKLTKAKNAFFYSLIGAAILLGSWALAKLIAETVLAL